MYGTTGIILVTITRTCVTDVEVPITQNDVFTPDICIGVNVDRVVLHPRGNHHVFGNIIGNLAFENGSIACYDVFIGNLNLIFLLHNYQQKRCNSYIYKYNWSCCWDYNTRVCFKPELLPHRQKKTFFFFMLCANNFNVWILKVIFVSRIGNWKYYFILISCK